MPDQLSRYRLILLPVSGSESSLGAAAHAAMLARAMDATVAILGVIDTSDGFSFGAEGMAAYQRLRAATQMAIEAASAVIRAAGVGRVEHLIMDGVPAEAILEVADEQGADLIVLGVRAMLGDNSSGRVIGHVIQHARRPVLIVPTERKSR
ncbi:MAG TPA: universal stress protein [Thermomicrobiales bacterium]|jgi:nucleotide-binding universal stress UspA family protein